MMKKFLCVILSIALVTGVAVLSAGAIRSEVPGVQAVSGVGSAPWWQSLPGWVQGILRYLFFGWIWMKPVVTDIKIYFLDADGKGNVVIKQGETIRLAANVLPSNATNKSVTWSVDDTDRATIDQSGVLTAKKTGDSALCWVRVTATAADGKGAYDTEDIGIEPPGGITTTYTATTPTTTTKARAP